MENTFFQLVNKKAIQDTKIRYFEKEAQECYEKIDEIFAEITERFAPRFWLGQEFKFTTVPENFVYPNGVVEDYLNHGLAPFVKYKIPGLKPIHLGKKFKVTFVRLITVYEQEKGFYVMWALNGNIELKNGGFGKEIFEIKYVDKIEVEK